MPAQKIDLVLYRVAAFLLALIPWQFYFKLYHNLDISAVSLLELFLLLLLLWKHYPVPQPFAGKSRLTLPVTFFWGTMLFSIFFAAKTGNALKYGLKLSSYIFLYYLFFNLEIKLSQLKKMLLIVVGMGLVLAALGIMQSFWGKASLEFIQNNPFMDTFIESNTRLATGNFVSQQVYKTTIRPATVFAEVITFTAFLGLMFPLALGLIFGQPFKTEGSLLALTGIIIIPLTIYLTQTRSAYLALLATFAVLGGFALRGEKKLILFTTLAGILLAGILFFSVFRLSDSSDNSIGQLAWQRTQTGFTTSENQHRIKCWLRALEVTNKYPYLGIGVANANTRQEEFLRQETPPHNNYFLISCTQGILGLIGFFWLLTAALGAAKQLRQKPEYLAYGLGFAGLVVWLLVQGFFGHYFTNDKFAMLFWALLGILANLERLSATD